AVALDQQRAPAGARRGGGGRDAGRPAAEHHDLVLAAHRHVAFGLADDVCHGAAHQAAVRPPSTTSSAPVVKADSSLARKRIVLATSSGLPSRPSGAAASRPARSFAGSRARANIASSMGVSAKEGCTELQRML